MSILLTVIVNKMMIVVVVVLVFLDATTHLYKRLCPSAGPYFRPSVGPSVPRYFRTTNMAVFEDKKSSNDTINNDK